MILHRTLSIHYEQWSFSLTLKRREKRYASVWHGPERKHAESRIPLHVITTLPHPNALHFLASGKRRQKVRLRYERPFLIFNLADDAFYKNAHARRPHWPVLIYSSVMGCYKCWEVKPSITCTRSSSEKRHTSIDSLRGRYCLLNDPATS